MNTNERKIARLPSWIAVLIFASFLRWLCPSDRRLDYVEMFTSCPEVRATMYDQALKKVRMRALSTKQRTRLRPA